MIAFVYFGTVKWHMGISTEVSFFLIKNYHYKRKELLFFKVFLTFYKNSYFLQIGFRQH